MNLIYNGASAVGNMSKFRNVWDKHGIKVLNGILFIIVYIFNIRVSSCTVSMTLILVWHVNIIAWLIIVVGNSSYRCTV